MRFLVIVTTDHARPFVTRHSDVLARGGVLLDAADLRQDAFDHEGNHIRGTPVHGYWLIDVRTPEEAVERVRRIPVQACVVEIREVAVV